MKDRKRQRWVFVGDFETTVYEGQERTDVWAAALTRLFDPTDHVEVFNSLPAMYDWILQNVHTNCIIYHHNLKFDGPFYISYLLERGDYTQAYEDKEPITVYAGTRFETKVRQGEFAQDKDMQPCTFKYLISDMGQWYTVKIKRPDGYMIELRDSLKLIPCSVKKMGKDFNTKHRKTEIEYEGYRQPGGYISPKEKEYIANDVLVPKEVLEIMYNEGHNKLTIGACCLSEFKSIIGDKPKGRSRYDDFFPKLDTVELDKDIYGASDADTYIRRSYHGGWCYVKKGVENQLQGHGVTLDVNSLYPSVMISQSGNRYPVDYPHFFHDLTTWDRIKNDPKLYYYVRVRTRFYLKPGYLPFIQIKRNKLYNTTEMLETSDVYDKHTGKYLKFLKQDGELIPTSVEITFSKTDWELVQEHYDLYETEILDGCWFYTAIGLFDEYINKYKKIKETSKGARRSVAKLFSNNLYGKLSSGRNSSFKILSLDDIGAITSDVILECNKECGYIADGAAITSYARAFTIRHAQANYENFCYSDTDSCHILGTPETVKGFDVHPTEYLCWKVECEWDRALFVRQKTYAEHVVKEDGEPVNNPRWDIKCAGLPSRCKELFAISIKGIDNVPKEDIMKLKLKPREWDFVRQKREITDFKEGLRIPGKLLPVHIPGGVVLADVDFTLH